jgi:parallel beta-helix repeat protein
MLRKVVAVWVSLIIIISSVVILVEIADMVEAPTTLYVGGAGPGNYSKIQWAIDNASVGDTVFVYNGTYYENIVINLTINLTGEHWDNTLIDGSGNGDVVTVNADWVNITGVSIIYGSPFGQRAGLRIESDFNTIIRNNISKNHIGIYLYYSRGNNISENILTSNSGSSVYLTYSENNNISYNRATENRNGFEIDTNSVGNIVRCNNASFNYRNGVLLEHSFMNYIIDNNVSFNNWNGIYLRYSERNILYGNTATFNRDSGIYFYYSERNNLTYNFISNSTILYGVYLYSSGSNNITGNTMLNEGIYLSGSLLSHWNTQDIDISNTINGNPIYYWKNQKGGIIPPGAGEVIIANCSDIEIKNHNLSYSSIGILLGFSSNNNISKNEISNNRYGILLYNSTQNNIIDNDVFSNRYQGISVTNSDNNNISSNRIFLNFGIGVRLYDDNMNIITNNNISNNGGEGIRLYYSDINFVFSNSVLNCGSGICLYYSDFNNIINNNASLNSEEGLLLGMNSEENNITRNILFSNSIYGIKVESADSSRNRIYYNNILNNTNQAFDNTNNGNHWDNSYPPGGNYWSDYSGVDNFKGPYQDIPGSDGIGDTPYIIDANSQDNYPLMSPFANRTFENYMILKQGWNLISLPLIQEIQNLSTVLQMIEGYYDAVQWYDSSKANKPWKHNKIGKPFGNDLSYLNETMSFWIHITNPGDTIFIYNGTEPIPNQTIQLHPGKPNHSAPSRLEHGGLPIPHKPQQNCRSE